jgi:thiol-disulfide isomerase/thioredoxin
MTLFNMHLLTDMKTKIRIAFFSFIVFSIPLSVFSQNGYKITLEAKGLKNATVKLAFHLGNLQYIKDSLVTDSRGTCKFTGKDKLPTGVYFLIMPGNKYIEFLAEMDQDFMISCDTSDLDKTTRFDGSDLNQSFLSYHSNWKGYQDRAASLQKQIQDNKNNQAELSKLKKMASEQEERMKSWLMSEADKNSGNLLGAIIKSMIPIYVDIPEIPQKIHNQDSVKRLWSYIYYKNHFFDNTDLNNPGLIRSPVLASKLDQFFSQVVIQAPDSISKEAGKLIRKCKGQKEVYQYVTSWIFNKYASSTYMGHDAIIVYLADSIYLAGKAPWVSKEYIADLSQKVNRLRPNLIGKKAVDLVMDSYSGQYVSLFDVRAEFTILYFWEPDCGHCKEATPKLKEYYDSVKGKGIEVFAVCTKDDKVKWEKYIADHNLDWINGWDPNRLTHFDFFYNVDSTPIVYILDKNKIIIAKRLPVENVGPFIDNYRNYFKLKSAAPAR